MVFKAGAAGSAAAGAALTTAVLTGAVVSLFETAGLTGGFAEAAATLLSTAFGAAVARRDGSPVLVSLLASTTLGFVGAGKGAGVVAVVSALTRPTLRASELKKPSD
jgi:hypothetical protein